MKNSYEKVLRNYNTRFLGGEHSNNCNVAKVTLYTFRMQIQ